MGKCPHKSPFPCNPEQWAANVVAPREQLGCSGLAQGLLSRGIEGGRERSLFTPPHRQSLKDPDSNPQPRVISPTLIRPRLPRGV